MSIVEGIAIFLAGLIAVVSPSVGAHSQTEAIKFMTQIGQTNSTQGLAVTRTFDAPVDQVWKHWTNSEIVKNPAKVGAPKGIPQEVRHVVTFKTVGDNKTEMTVTEYGYASDQTVETYRLGLEQCLDKMAQSLRAGK